MTEPAPDSVTVALDLASARLVLAALGILGRARGSGTPDYDLCVKARRAIQQALKEASVFHSFPRVVPFETSVYEYIRDHPGASYAQAVADLGIGVAAIHVAISSLQAKGLIAYGDELDTETSP